MSKLSYLARVMSGVRLKKMNQMIDIVHDKCGQNKVKTFFDMCWCGARYGAGYYDYVMFGFYNMNGRQRDTYLTRVRNKKVIDHMNDLSYSDEFDDKLRFNQRFAKYLGRKTSTARRPRWQSSRTSSPDRRPSSPRSTTATAVGA